MAYKGDSAEETIGSRATGSVESIRTARLLNGSYVVIWTETSPALETTLKISVRNAQGDPVSATATIPGGADADILPLPDGGFVISYRDPSRSFLQHFTDLGVSLDEPVDLGAGSSAQSLSCFALDDGGWIVTWTRPYSPSDPGGTFVQRYDARGTLIGRQTFSDDPLISIGSVIALENGRLFITTREQRDPIGPVETFARLYDADFSPVGDKFAVGGADAIILENGNVLLTWQASLPEGDTYQWDVFAQLYAPAGTAIGSPFRVNAAAEGDQGRVTSAALSDGGFVLSWTTGSGDDTDIHARFFDARGGPVGEELLVNTVTAGGQDYTGIAVLESGDVVFTWADADRIAVQQRVFHPENGGRQVGGRVGEIFFGTNGADQISGGGGDDIIFGYAGADRMSGGPGHDRYVVESREDRVIERAGRGMDVVEALIDYRLPANVENLQLVTGRGRAAPVRGIGNASDNIITGNSTDNVLDGLGGNDRLVGAEGDDRLDGGAGNDTLIGGPGRDLLIGGSGADLFLFTAGSSGTTARTADLIRDFSHAEGDRIDLSRIVGDRDVELSLGNGRRFTGREGEVLVRQGEGVTIVRVDLNGDSVSDFEIRLTGEHALIASDFIF